MRTGLREIARKYIKKPYYDVPVCPKCGSPVTGRFVQMHRKTETDWMINESLRNGELVKPADDIPGLLNAFCLECGYVWGADISIRMLSLKQIDEQKRIRHTSQILEERMEEEANRKKLGGPIGAVSRFVGKL